MSNQNQQTQQQQRQQQQQPAPWKPPAGTLFLLQSDEAFVKRARDFVRRKWGQTYVDRDTGKTTPWNVTTEIDCAYAGDATIVVLYMDPEAPIKDGDGYRPRELGKRNKAKGYWEVEPEDPEVLYTKPIHTREYRKRDRKGETMDVAGLCAAITDSMQRDKAIAGPARARLADRDGQMIITVGET